LPVICVHLKNHSVARPMGGQPERDASRDMSRATRRSALEPTEAIPQNQRHAVGILFPLGRGGCQQRAEQERPAKTIHRSMYLADKSCSREFMPHLKFPIAVGSHATAAVAIATTRLLRVRWSPAGGRASNNPVLAGRNSSARHCEAAQSRPRWRAQQAGWDQVRFRRRVPYVGAPLAIMGDKDGECSAWLIRGRLTGMRSAQPELS